jgi:hypothetical protein
LRMPASMSECRSRSSSRTSVLVCPRTLPRIRLPSGPCPSETTPRQLPVHRQCSSGSRRAPCGRSRWSPRSGHGVPPSPGTGLRGNRMAPALAPALTLWLPCSGPPREPAAARQGAGCRRSAAVRPQGGAGEVSVSLLSGKVWVGWIS